MTLPKDVKPGDIVMTTARTIRRAYFLRPDPEIAAAAAYVIGHYAKKHKMVMYAVCVMSTHVHMIYKDTLGRHPKFLREVHRALALVCKAKHKFRDSAFSENPNVVRILTPQALIDRIAYVHANPVAGGAVRRIPEWPGLNSTTADLSAPARTFARPKLYFRERGLMPDEAELKFELPESLIEVYGEQATRDAIAAATRRHADTARKMMNSAGRRFMGAYRCRTVSPRKEATSHENWGERVPTFAIMGGGKKAYKKAVKALRAFRAAYREALAAWRQGDRDVEFPYGTWKMRVLHDVRCAPAPG